MVGENMVWTLWWSLAGRGSLRMSFSLLIQIWMMRWHRNWRWGTFFITHATWRLKPAATNRRRSLWPQHRAVSGLPWKTEINKFEIFSITEKSQRCTQSQKNKDSCFKSKVLGFYALISIVKWVKLITVERGEL